jgi:DNA polymerase-3 subunit epsilon
VATAIAFLTESRIDRSEVRQNVFMPATWMYAFSIRLTPTPLESGDGVHFMDDVEFIAFDLETTGLHSTFCQIVEIGAVRFRADGTEVGRMEQLVDPGCPVPERAVAVHGITDDMLLGQPRIEDVLPEFVKFVGSSESILLAHNASFDLRFLSAAWNRIGASVPDHPVVDTLDLSRGRLRQLPNYRLETVNEHLHITDFTEHRALGDALVVKEVFLRLLEQHPAIKRMDELFNSISPLHFEQFVPVPINVPTGYEPLVEAIEIRQSISIVYDGGTKGRRKRLVTPRRLIESRGSLYLIARCHIDDIEKHFRLDRILEIEGE